MYEGLSAAIVGAGRVGAALARWMSGSGTRVVTVISRNRASAVAIAPDGAAASSHLEDLPTDLDAVFLTVPDAEVAALARAVSEVRETVPRYAIHTSGLLTSEELAPLRDRGAAAVSFHPLAAFPRDPSANPFSAITVTLEGDPEAIQFGRHLARALEARAVAVSRDQKAVIHAAAAMCANFSVTLFAAATQMLKSAGLDADVRNGMLLPLMDSVLTGLAASPPEDALTGPIVRGDVEIVTRHLEVIRSVAPELAALYCELGEATVKVAERSGRLGHERALELRRLLARRILP